MADMSDLLDRRGIRLHSSRLLCIDAYDRLPHSPPQLRAIVIAAEWALHAADAVRHRRSALLAAERELIWQLSRPPTSSRFAPGLRSRPTEAIEGDLEAELRDLDRPDTPDRSDAAAGHRIDVLIHELAAAELDRLLMAPVPVAPELLAELIELINHLGYEVARGRPRGVTDWNVVTAALRGIRSALDESWLGDVGRRDLQRINTVLGALSGPELDATISLLTDDELYRWFHELDGVRGGNLAVDEEAELFRLIANRAAPATLLRLALAEGGSRFAEIVAAVSAVAPLETAMEFVELCAAGAATSERLLIGSLTGLAALDETPRRIVLTSLQTAGLLEPLAAATTSFIEANTLGRTEPLIVEFFGGLMAAVRDGAVAIADLSVAALVDRHRFREAWSSLSEVAGLAVDDPAAFVAVVLDIDMLRRNPARWLGATSADLASFGLGKLARLGRLGRTARAVADLFKRIGESQILRVGKARLRAGHLQNLIGRLNAAADALELRSLLVQVEAITAATTELQATVAELPSLPLHRAMDRLNRVIERVTGEIALLGRGAGSIRQRNQMIESSLPAT